MASTMLGVLKNVKRSHLLAAFYWLIWNMIFGLLPIWVTALSLRLLNVAGVVESAVANGEFALYSASYVGAAWYFVVYESKKETRFPGQLPLHIVSVVLLITSLIVYLTIRIPSSAAANAGTTLDLNLVAIVSWILLPLSLALGFFLHVVDGVLRDPDVGALGNVGFRRINKEFDDLGDN
jgi:hypothetical protein